MKLVIALFTISLSCLNAHAGAGSAFTVAGKAVSKAILPSAGLGCFAGGVISAPFAHLAMDRDLVVARREVFSDTSKISGLVAGGYAFVWSSGVLQLEPTTPIKTRFLSIAMSVPVSFLAGAGGALACSNAMYPLLERIDKTAHDIYFSE